jgi:hypothetical protein
MLALRPALLEWFWTRTGVPQANRSQYSPHGLGGDGRSGVRTCHTPRSSRPRTPPRPCQKRLVIEAAWGAKPLPVAGGWPARRLNDQPFHAPIHGQRQPAVAARLRIALRPARDVVATLSQSDKEQWRHRASSVKTARPRDGTGPVHTCPRRAAAGGASTAAAATAAAAQRRTRCAGCVATPARHRATGHADTHSPAAVPTHGKYTFLDKNRRDIGESQSEQAQPQQPQQPRSRTWAACPPAKARGRNHRRRLQCRPHHPKTEATATAGVSSRRVPIPPEPFLDRNRRDIGGSQPNTGHTSHSTHTRLAAQRPGTGTHHVVQRRTRRRHTPHLRRAGNQD